MKTRSVWVVLFLLLAGVCSVQAATVTGTVTDSLLVPIEGAHVVLHSSHHGGGGHGGLMYETWTDADGMFLLEEVEAGDYTARASLFGYGMDEAEITVEEGATVTIDFVLDCFTDPPPAGAVGTVTGTVTDTLAAPLDSARVILRHGFHGGGHGGGGMMQVYETWTDADGMFTFEEVAVGDYVARAMLTGYGMDEADITVEEDLTTTVDFVLDGSGPHGGGHHGGHEPHGWEEVTLSGWAIVVDNPDPCRDAYFIDEENDGVADYRLGFGPPDYEPPSGAELPLNGDEIDIVGGELFRGHPGDVPMVIVFEINGLVWFVPDSLGGQHNSHGGQWHQDHNGCNYAGPTSIEAEGYVVVDENANGHNQYGLDIDADDVADFRLTYGVMSYSPGNGSDRPVEGDWVEIVGGLIDHCPGLPTIVVYAQNSDFWREPGDIEGLDTITTGLGETTVSTPVDHMLLNAYPNPFNPTTMLTVTMNQASNLQVQVYDVLGRVVMQQDLGNVSAGAHQLQLDASSWAAGVYFVNAIAGSQQQAVKVLLLK